MLNYIHKYENDYTNQYLILTTEQLSINRDSQYIQIKEKSQHVFSEDMKLCVICLMVCK